MEPIITKLIVKRFRSFPNEVATFGNPTFLVGKNGAGKSNFADIFRLVSEAMRSPLPTVFKERHGIAAVRNRTAGSGYPPNLGIGIHLGAINGQVRSAHFSFEIKALPNYSFDIVRGHPACAWPVACCLSNTFAKRIGLGGTRSHHSPRCLGRHLGFDSPCQPPDASDRHDP